MPIAHERGTYLEIMITDPLIHAMTALATGRMSALNEIYEICADEIFGLALWRTGSRDDAADVMQDVFVRLGARCGKDLKLRNPRAYLLSMTHRAAIDLLRRKRPAVGLDDCLVESTDAPVDDTIYATQVSHMLHRLSPQQREAVYLKHFAELSFAEIGDITGVPTFTAASRYRLGIRRLRKLLGVEV